MDTVEKARQDCLFALTLGMKGAAPEVVHEEMIKSLDHLMDLMERQGFWKGRIYEATRWAFWHDGEEICGYSSHIPLRKVLEGIGQDDRKPTAHFGGIK